MFVERINVQSLGSPRFASIGLNLQFTNVKTLIERNKKSSQVKKILKATKTMTGLFLFSRLHISTNRFSKTTEHYLQSAKKNLLST